MTRPELINNVAARAWRIKNTLLLLLSLVLFGVIYDSAAIAQFLNFLGSLEYLGALIAGIFFVITFTAAPAGLILFKISQDIPAIEVSLLAGLGALIGDFLIFRLVKDGLSKEWAEAAKKLNSSNFNKIFSTPFFAWITPILGAIIIASPLPDEIGVTILGLTKMKPWKFALISLILNTSGIFILLSFSKIIF